MHSDLIKLKKEGFTGAPIRTALISGAHIRTAFPSGESFFRIAPFPDRCLFVPFHLFIKMTHSLRVNFDTIYKGSDETSFANVHLNTVLYFYIRLNLLWILTTINLLPIF